MSFRSKLIGTWQLLSWQIVDSEERELAQPFGGNISGSLVYSSDGYMSAMISGSEVNSKPWVKWNDPTVEEALSVGKFFTGYTGKFFLDEVPGNRQTVFHEIRISLPPNLQGATQQRSVEIFEKNQEPYMTIRVEHDVDWFGQKGQLLLQWKKEVQNDKATPNAAAEPLGAR